MPLSENRRLKAAGLAVVALAIALFSWLGGHRVDAAERLHDAARFLTLTVAAVNLTAVGLLLIAAGCGARRSWRNRRHRRAIVLQVLLANVLVPAVAFALITSDERVNASVEARGWATPLSAVATVLLVIAWRLWRRAQKYEALSADEAMSRDPRPPVLYLRSFTDDDDATLEFRSSRIERWLMSLVSPRTPEQELAEILDHLGPVIAIGKPGEPLPQLGAARLYVSHDEWQQTVMTLMAQARLIVIRVGRSAGVAWEIERALERVPRERLVLIAIGSGRIAPALVSRLSEVLGQEFPLLAPDLERETVWRWLWRNPWRRLGAVVCFPGGMPRAVPMTMWPFWNRDVLPMFRGSLSALPLRRAWRTTFALLGCDAGAMAARRSRAVAVALAVGFGWTGAHWFYLGQRRRGVKYLLMLVVVPMFLGLYDAVRFILIDQAGFDAECANGNTVSAGTPDNRTWTARPA